MLSLTAAAGTIGLAMVSLALAQTTTVPNTATDTAAIAQQLATVMPVVPVTNKPGKVFNRFVNIMMENIDFDTAAADPNMQKLQALGITLTNYYGTTHPSEPNYCASYGGDHFGMDNDNFNQIPTNISNIWDILDDAGISFASYQQDLPYPGFEGFEFLDPGSGLDHYVRKHNPPVLFNRNVEDTNRRNTIKSFQAFESDLNNNALPQHMFITPNELNDAHDTGIEFGASFLFEFLSPLLDNPFFMNSTLVVINFDENGNDTKTNNVLTILISDTMPKALIGTSDSNVYTHYSNLATVEANWGLPTLGRWDVAANVYSYVAAVTGDIVRPPQVPVGQFFLNSSYPGPFAATNIGPFLIPNTSAVVNGRPVFQDVVAQWGGLQECTPYDESFVVPPDGMRPPKAVPASCATLQPSVIPVTTDALLPTFVSVKPMITSLPATPAAGQTVIIPHTSTATIAIELELATNLPLSPVSHVQGKVFNRFVNIMMENTDFSVAAADPNMQNLQALGITLTNYFGTTHPSEPNYCAIYGGDNFGMDNDDFNQVPLNVSNVWDLLADKGISFGSYQEDLPYPGFEGFQFLNPGSDADNYVRKHNPPVLFNTNVQDPSRLNTIKSFDQFFEDLNNNALPQHMFITPNELNDAHDTGITYGADFLFSFLAPLLENPFFMNNTLVVINFDENVTDDIANNVLTILISDTMPKELIGTTDANVYTHYSNIATVEANWDLETLGRWDVAANVYSYVANVTGDVVRPPQVPLGSFFLNESYPGPFAVKNTGGVLIPNTTLVVNGRPVFKDVVEQWGSLQECTVYDDLSVVPPDGLRLPKAIPASCASLQPNILATATSSPVSTSTSVVISNSATSTGTSSPVSTSTSVVVSNSATSTGTSSPVSTSTSAVVSNSATSTGASSPVSTSTSVVVSNSATSTGASSPVSTSSAALSAVTAAPAGGSSSNGVAPPSGSSSNGAAPAGGSSSNGAAPASGSSPNGAAPASGSSSNGAAPAGGSSPNGVAPSGLLPGAATTAGAAPTMFTGASVSAFGDLSKALLIGSGLAVLALAL